MSHQLAICAIGQADIENRKALAQFQEMRHGLHRAGGGFAQKVDIEVGRHGESHRADMGENRGIGRNVGKREERGA